VPAPGGYIGQVLVERGNALGTFEQFRLVALPCGASNGLQHPP
jgi:hypothetical protein